MTGTVHRPVELADRCGGVWVESELVVVWRHSAVYRFSSAHTLVMETS